MEPLSSIKTENIKSEIEDEPMDVNETPADDFFEEGEINTTDDEEDGIRVRMPENVSSVFSRSNQQSQSKGFVTGFNVFDKDEAQKKLERAKRFSLPVQTSDFSEFQKEKVTALYKDLGIDKENERHYRFNALHMRGTDNMSTDDVIDYFASYAPSHVEWINDVSCNIVWRDDVSAARALLNLSKRIKNLDKVHLNADPFEKDFKPNIDEEMIEEDDEDAVDARQIKVAIPPGFWRVGVPCEKSSFILLRYASKSDRKQRNAEKNSEYYKKYGNPHFGNIPGLISNSLRSGVKKSRIRPIDFQDRVVDPEADSKNPWAELAYEWGKTDKVERTDEIYARSHFIERDSSIPDLRISLTNKLNRKKRTRIELETNSSSSDKEIWESKTKVPRMKMYADEFETNSGKTELSYSKPRKIEEDLRTKINKKKSKPRLRFISEKDYKDESESESSLSDNDSDEGDWALEHYRDLRESLEQSKRHRRQKQVVKYESESEEEEDDDVEDEDENDEIYKGDFSRRSPLQIEIENDEYYLNRRK